MKNKWLALIFCLFFILPASAEFVPGQMIVRFKPGSAVGSVTQLNQKFGVIDRKKLHPSTSPPAPLAGGVQLPDFSNDYLLYFDESADIEAIVKEYKKDGNVIFAQPNFIYKALLTPNDPGYPSQWGLPKIQADSAWEISTGEANSIIVADLDTGVNYNHEDLTGKVLLGYDFANGDNNPMDDNGHGTHIAGIIGASTNNLLGVAGVNWNALILAVKVLDARGYGSSIDVKDGMVYAADYPGCRIINMSFGQYSEDTYIRSGAEYAYAKGMILVAAAGNENTSDPIYPGSYSYVIGVAATDQNDQRSVWNISDASNFATWIDIAAPGTAIYSTWTSGYRNSQGTSMATPFVCGAAAMLLSINPSLTPEQVKTVLEATADNIDAKNPGFEGLLGKGRLNLYNALQTYLTTEITSPVNNECIRNIWAITGTAGGYAFSSYNLFLSTGGTTKEIHSSTIKVEDGTLYNFDTTAEMDGAYIIRLVNTGAAGLFSAEASVSIKIDNTLPTAEITAPLNGATAEGTINITGTASDANFNYYYLEYSSDGVSYQRISTSSTPKTNAVLGTWDTRNLTGAYFLRLVVVDCAGNSNSQLIGIVITAQNTQQTEITSLIKSSPNPFNPNQQTETYIYYTLSENYAIEILLFNLQGQLIWRTYCPSGTQGGKAGDNLVPWNGRDSSGVSAGNGVYLYKIVATINGVKKPIGSGKLIVLRN